MQIIVHFIFTLQPVICESFNRFEDGHLSDFKVGVIPMILSQMQLLSATSV